MNDSSLNSKNDQLAKYAGILSIIEIGLGGFLHGLRLPLSGQILSINQIFILTHASLKIPDNGAPALVSTTAALFKTLSPAGKKLTPMLAITCQGHLYSLGLWIFGVNLFGRLLGALLSSLWAYIQPIVIYLILFGEDLIYIYDYFFKKLSELTNINHENFYLILFSIIFLKFFLSILTVLLAYKIKDEHLDKFQDWAKDRAQINIKKKKYKNPFFGALKDLLNPMFSASIVLTFIFFYFVKSDHSNLIWIMLRPLALGYILFFILRVMPLERRIEKLKAGKYKDLLQKTIKKIQS